jgi:hypothetical protein
MPLHGLRAVFMRGGTSKALMFQRRDLPEQQEDWAPIFLAAMGAPDPNGRQLDGMGGGVSSLSKVCVIGPSTHPEADVDYTFVQVGIDDATVDYGGNCGNMSSAVGPFAVDEGLVKAPEDGPTTVGVLRYGARSPSMGFPAPARPSVWNSATWRGRAPAGCCRPASLSIASRCRGGGSSVRASSMQPILVSSSMRRSSG